MNQTHQLQPAGVAAIVARVEPSKPEGEQKTVKHKEEIFYAHQYMVVEGGQGDFHHDTMTPYHVIYGFSN